MIRAAILLGAALGITARAQGPAPRVEARLRITGTIVSSVAVDADEHWVTVSTAEGVRVYPRTMAIVRLEPDYTVKQGARSKVARRR